MMLEDHADEEEGLRGRTIGFFVVLPTGKRWECEMC